MAATTTRTRMPFPSELLHKILTDVLAESIHAICVAPKVCRWDMNIVWILAGTCYTWRAIVKDILVMAFAQGAGESTQEEHKSDKEFFHLIHVKLNQLRAFGECSREEFSSNPFLRPIVMQDSCPLTQSYSLYLTSMALRGHVDHMDELNTVAHESIVNALRAARKVCEKVMPRGLTRTLVGALENHILVVEFGLTMAKRHIALEDCLSKLPVSALLDFMEAEDETGVHPSPHEDRSYDIRTEMQNEIQIVENISCPSCSNIDTDAAEVRRLLDMSGIIDTLKKCRGLSLAREEYDLGRHAGALIERWGQGTSEY